MRGAFRAHPERKKAREGEPEVSGGLGKAPDVMDEAEKARWNEIRKWCPWLVVSDRVIVEQTCRLWTLERKGKATTAQSKLLASNLGQLGMTAATRSKVRMPEAPSRGEARRTKFFGKG